MTSPVPAIAPGRIALIASALNWADDSNPLNNVSPYEFDWWLYNVGSLFLLEGSPSSAYVQLLSSDGTLIPDGHGGEIAQLSPCGTPPGMPIPADVGNPAHYLSYYQAWDWSSYRGIPLNLVGAFNIQGSLSSTIQNVGKLIVALGTLMTPADLFAVLTSVFGMTPQQIAAYWTMNATPFWLASYVANQYLVAMLGQTLDNGSILMNSQGQPVFINP